MAADRNELAARIAATQAGDSIRGLFFNVLLHVAAARAGEAARSRLQLEWRPDGYGDLRNYPVEEFLNLMYDIADLPVGPSASGDAAAPDAAGVLYACGASSVLHFAKGGPGQLVFGILGRADPHRLFAQVGMAFSTVVSYGKRTYSPTGEKSGVLRFERDMQPPAYHRGIIEGALRALGTSGHVSPRVLGIDRVDYEVSWV